ncbi:hypothetical protein H4R21_001058, partial [Coemansia helicoidea]
MTVAGPDSGAEEPSWGTLQDRLRMSVVSITSSSSLPFDMQVSGALFASGFIVDAEQGLVLSNRHVVGAGPTFHKATFFDNQEVHLQPLYYDPEHDFGFLRYDPAEVTGTPPRAIRLAPEKARSGLEIRVIGNDSNEKLSVQRGELSQLDRNPPGYRSAGEDTYNDLNTFYYQASTSSKGGSSGSPVVDIAGDAVAINAGGSVKSSSSFFLPLQRVRYALDYVLRGEVPPRGTVQAEFRHITHVQAERLGLEPRVAAAEGVRVKGTTGVLTVHKVLPGGPADGRLAVGDIVVSVGGCAVPGFTELAELVDAAVGGSVDVRVFRSGQLVTASVPVQDLYDITPTAVLWLGGTFLHSQSLQLSIGSSAPVTGVQVVRCDSGFLALDKIGKCTVVHAVNNQPTPDLGALMGAMAKVRHGDPIVVRLKSHHDPRIEAVVVTYLPPAARPGRLYTRSPATGFWSVQPFATAAVVPPQRARLPCVPPAPAAGLAARIQQSMVHIEAHPLCPADGYYSKVLSGSGSIVDRRHGLILCSTRLVANPTCDIAVTFGGIQRIHATLAYVHPLYPVAFLKYDPALLTDEAAVSDCDLELTAGADDPGRLQTGDAVTVFASSELSGVALFQTAVAGRTLLRSDTCKWCVSRNVVNTEFFALASEPPRICEGLGIVCDGAGRVRGLWVPFPVCSHVDMVRHAAGLDIALVLPVLAQLQRTGAVAGDVHVLDVEFGHEPLSAARALGMSDSRVAGLVRAAPGVRTVLKVAKILHVRPAGVASLEIGDIVLAANGAAVRHINDVACFYSSASVELTVARGGEERTVAVPTLALRGTATRRVVHWAGMYLQEAAQVASQIYNFTNIRGGPAVLEEYHFHRFVTEIGGTKVHTMDDLVAVARSFKHPELAAFNDQVMAHQKLRSGAMPGRDVSLRTVLLNGEDLVRTFRTNDQYFPAWQLTRGPRIDDEWVYE